jgi:anaerobic ribonucleoside-triphosphate reductase
MLVKFYKIRSIFKKFVKNDNTQINRKTTDNPTPIEVFISNSVKVFTKAEKNMQNSAANIISNLMRLIGMLKNLDKPTNT